MENSKVDILVEDDTGITFLIECPQSISYSNFKEILKIKVLDEKVKRYYIIFKGKKYNDKNKQEILNFLNGDKVVIVNTLIKEGVFAKVHMNPELDEVSEKLGKLTGFLRLILIKYISTSIKDINLIASPEIKEIVSELRKDMKIEEDPEEDIKSNLKETSGKDIISYTKYVCSIISDQDIDNLLSLIGENLRNNIKNYWSILTLYEKFNKSFGQELFKIIKNSYFDYSLIGLSIYQQSNRKNYLQTMNDCSNLIKKYLFHGTQIDPISKIITKGFLYSRKPFYGMGIYFTDMLDYVSFYCGGNDFNSRRNYFGKILPVNTTFSCVGAEIYYDKKQIQNVFDYSYYVDELDHFPTYDEIKNYYDEKMIPLYGVNIARVEPKTGRVKKEEEIKNDKIEGKFIGKEYVITEKNQILPLYGLTFKRNEYLLIWRDPNFVGNNDFSRYLNAQKLFIYKYAKINAYFESSIEKALELIQKKKFNKIIIITNIGLDLSGKKFVEIARQILGFNVVALFFSNNTKHLSWLQNFPNALYTNNSNFYIEYIFNYNYNGLLQLKKKIEVHYNIRLPFDNKFLLFPKFINQNNYDDIIFDEPFQFFKKIIIKNTKNNSILGMNESDNPLFYSFEKLNIKLFMWYVTIAGNEITLFSNGNYLGANLQIKIATKEQFMQRLKYDKIDDNEFILYFENKSNVLTENGNHAIISKEDYNNRADQIFKFIEVI